MRGISWLDENLVDLWLPPRSRSNLLSSGILRGVWWLNLDDGTDRLFRNVGKEFPPTIHCVISFRSGELVGFSGRTLLHGVSHWVAVITFWPMESLFTHSVFCLTTGPAPLPKRFLHIVRSRASYFKWEYPLLSLRSSSDFLRLPPCLLVTSISPFIFPSITCFKDKLRQHPDQLIPILLEEQGPRRLKRYNPFDLTHRFSWYELHTVVVQCGECSLEHDSSCQASIDLSSSQPVAQYTHTPQVQN
jgi:hypothetical protein